MKFERFYNLPGTRSYKNQEYQCKKEYLSDRQGEYWVHLGYSKNMSRLKSLIKKDILNNENNIHIVDLTVETIKATGKYIIINTADEIVYKYDSNEKSNN